MHSTGSYTTNSYKNDLSLRELDNGYVETSVTLSNSYSYSLSLIISQGPKLYTAFVEILVCNVTYILLYIYSFIYTRI